MKNIIVVAAVLLAGLLSQPLMAQQLPAKNEYHNPVIAGDFPDPSVIRVGDRYYAAGTTSDFAPHYPIYESTDLVNWKQIGSVFNETPEWLSVNFWAPELVYHHGTFFVYYTAKRKSDRIACIGVASTKDIYKGFTDHGPIIEWGNEAIDAYIFQDDDNKRYITWKAYGLDRTRPIEILGSELSEDGLSLVGDHFTLTDHSKGWQGSGDEGQCIVKMNGYYYMLYSVGGCCDNRCDYRVRVARSKEMKKGWEQYPEPILQGGGEWLCTGHGTLVSTPDNRFFYLYHAYNATDFEYVGRQGMLDELLWDDVTGWPYFKNGNTPSVKAEAPMANTPPQQPGRYFDDFRDNSNLKYWQWDVVKGKPRIDIGNRQLKLSFDKEGFQFAGLATKSGNYTFEAGLSQSTATAQGVGIYGNSRNLLTLMVQGDQLLLITVKDGKDQIVAQKTLENKDPIALKLEVSQGRYYRFFYSTRKSDWVELKSNGDKPFDGQFLPQWGVAPRTGLIWKSLGKEQEANYWYVNMEDVQKQKFN